MARKRTFSARDLPPWIMGDIAPVLSGPLDDAAAEQTIRATLRLAEPFLARLGTTPALLAKELIRRRRQTRL